MKLEITAISVEGITNSSPSFCFFCHPLKPFITITTFPPPDPSSSSSSSSSSCHVYTTRVDNTGGPNPTWADKFHVPLDPTFFTSRCSYVYLQLYTMRALLGRALVGWIQIPASDILDGLSPIGSAHHLSYRLLEKGGSRGRGVVNVALRLVGEVPVARSLSPGQSCLAAVHTWRAAIGVPVTWRSDEMDNIARRMQS